MEFQHREKIPVAVLGATGRVGQKFVELLLNHPWFEIAYLAASEKSVGKPFSEFWKEPTHLPDSIANMSIEACEPGFDCALVFSALSANIAGEVEKNFATAGYTVISNARNHRMESSVPLLIPEVNADHLHLLDSQKQGRIVTNPNCSTMGLTLALKPIVDHFGINSVHVSTMQAVSGAGYGTVLDIEDNVIPHIEGEEGKIEIEPLKILGSCVQDSVQNYICTISAQCHRVPVSDGHLLSVSLNLKNPASKEEMISAFRDFKGEPQALKLPMAPEHPIYYFDEEHYPQPKLHRNLDKAMAVSVGRLRECPLFDYKFSILSHNTIRGGAGGAILSAELMVKKGYIFW